MKKLKIIWILFALISILIWMPRLDGLLTKEYSAISDCVVLDDGWDITINEDTWQNVRLTELQFAAVSKGDKIIMQRTLPANWGLVEGALRFHIRHSAVSMYVDDALLYEYGVDRLAAGKTLGSGYQFINFPNTYQGKRFRIQMTVAEEKVFTKLDSIRLYEWKNAYRVLITENRLPLFSGCFLILFGLIVCVITIFALLYSAKYIRLLCISLFSICMGLWTLSYYNIMLIFAVPLYSISLINYLALYLAPIPLTIYIREEVYNLKLRLLAIAYRVFLAIELAAVSVMLTLHTLDIVHLAGMLKYMQAILFIGLLFFLFVLLLNLKFSKLENRLSVLGMLIVIGCVAYDLVGYNSGRYLGMDIFKIRGVSSSGIMILICILFISFYIEMTHKMME